MPAAAGPRYETTGRSAGRSACFHTTRRSGSPFARAVRTKSWRITSTVPARARRAITAAWGSASVTLGSTALAKPPHPATGRPAEAQREHDHEPRPDDEVRQRDAEQREPHARVIRSRVGSQARAHAEADAQHEREQQRAPAEREAHGQRGREQLGHAAALHLERRPEIARQQEAGAVAAEELERALRHAVARTQRGLHRRRERALLPERVARSEVHESGGHGDEQPERRHHECHAAQHARRREAVCKPAGQRGGERAACVAERMPQERKQQRARERRTEHARRAERQDRERSDREERREQQQRLAHGASLARRSARSGWRSWRFGRPPSSVAWKPAMRGEISPLVT